MVRREENICSTKKKIVDNDNDNNFHDIDDKNLNDDGNCNND